ncbi:MAG TPA: pilus assembly protein PilM [Sedimentisphaerales bacterium]|jgi:type IV pilus assembly protein PilM|nr:pilus assembly protein PilM [Sedimentisphaerales bacterium]HNU28378.1 pilus assembly protein PilM [Sedimentisphaerales bacterium]
MIGFRRKNLIGLDIDTTAVRMVQLRREDDAYTVTGASATEIAPWGDDPELHRIHTIRAIQQGLSQRSIRGRLAVCGVRGPEVVVRSFEFPVLPPEEIGSAVGLEASQICPFSAQESTFDYQVTSIDARKTRGFWVAANNSLIRSTRHLVHQAGLHCAMIDVAGLALLNCVQNATSKTDAAQDPSDVPDNTAVVDIGGSCTTIAIVDQAGRPFVRDINSGSDEILRQMAQAAQVPLESAKTALWNYGVEPSAAEKAEGEAAGSRAESNALLWDNLEGACAVLVDDIATTLRYYAAQHGSGLPQQGAAMGGPASRVERLLVCGAFSKVTEFIELLRSKLYVDVTAWNPIETMPCAAAKARSLAPVLQEAGSSMSLAAGLAMRCL